MIYICGYEWMVSIGSCKNLNPKNQAKKIQTHTFNKTHLVVVVKKLLTKLEEGEVSRQAVNSSSREKSEKVKKFLDCQNFCSDRHAHTH